MKKKLLVILCMAFMVLGMMSSASAITITPSTSGIFIPGSAGNTNDTWMETNLGLALGTLDLLYKSEAEGGEDGGFALSYDTTFAPPIDPMNATIIYVGGPVINYIPLYLLVKDGSWGNYIFDLGGWNGTDTILLEGFWPRQGAISHVSIFGPTAVPEPTTLLLLGSGLVALCLVSRKFKR